MLSGVQIEFPDMVDRLAHMDEESGKEDTLETFADVDYEELVGECAAEYSKSPWGEDSKTTFS